MSTIRASAAWMAAIGSLAMSAAWCATAWCATPPAEPPAWAFARTPPAPRVPAANAAAKDAGAIRQVPGSAIRLTTAQTRNLFAVPDWFPDSHPSMPTVVASGRKPAVMACGYCHLPNGQGRPENAPLAGLPAAYIAEQIDDFRTGRRLAAAPISGPLSFMIGIARNVDDAEIQAAAGYFSQLHYQPWIRVVETRSVPKTRVAGGMYQPIPGAGTEPLGQRIIEIPENVERTELRDSKSGFIAYVPVGSLRRGEELVRTGDHDRTIRCTICHGADLRGLGGVPPIAGRSPSYLMRQLYDIRFGARHGLGDELMREPMAHLTPDDMLAIVAYVASQPP